MWHNKIDKIFVINLPERKDRLQKIKEELRKYEIPFDIFHATKHPNGADGLQHTMKDLFIAAKDFDNILVFEDDVNIIEDINKYLPLALKELPDDFDLLYLGANLNAPLNPVKKCAYILSCSYMLTTHAIIYSPKSRTTLLKDMIDNGIKKVERWKEPFDQTCERLLQRRGKCYISNPMIAVQYNGHSDVLNQESSWREKMIEKYNTELQAMAVREQ